MRQTPILLMPGASATGRDFLLEKLLAEIQEVAKQVDRNTLRIEIAMKTTDRLSRKLELTKKCVTDEEFDQGLTAGQIFAHYVLESNGHRYGYEANAFDSQEGVDLLIADASIYQVEALKKQFGERVHAAAIIADREFRRGNLLFRGSENPEEVEKRLNLGDAHVALSVMLSGDSTIGYREFIDPSLADLIDCLIAETKVGVDTTATEALIEKFTGSQNVCQIIKQLATNPVKAIDDLVIRRQEELADFNAPIAGTPLFKQGIRMIAAALKLGLD